MGGGGSSSQGAGRWGLLAEPEPVSACDLNFDGHITLEETLQHTDARFALLDTEGTGRLTLASLEQLLHARAAERPARRGGGGDRPGGGGGRRHGGGTPRA